MTTNPLIARFAGEPALVEPTMSERFEVSLTQAAAFVAEHAEKFETAAASEDFWNPEDRWLARFRPYVVVDGILQIPVKGVLLHNFPYQLFDWATGYDYIWEAFKRGCGDYVTGAIKGIALVCDTPGGMVAGCFDARDKMLALKAQVGVPVAGFAHESAYSAGYATITVADPGRITVSRTGGVGSIGVVTGHLSVAGAMEQRGWKFTYIFAGEGKVDGNPYEDLSAEAKARIQVRIDELYGIFVSAVARSRGMEESFIRETLGAHCYTATQAVSNGLADNIGTLEDATAAFAASLDAPSETEGEDNMADQAVTTVDQAVHDQAVAAARDEGMKAGVTAERARISGILASDEAKDRPVAALAAAMDTDMSLESATAFLAKLPKEAAQSTEAEAPAGAGFDAAMSNGNPNVGADGGKGKDGAEAKQEDTVLALIAGAGVPGFRAQTSK